MYAKVADSLRQTDQFRETEQWRFDWEQPYTCAQWLDLLRRCPLTPRAHAKQAIVDTSNRIRGRNTPTEARAAK